MPASPGGSALEPHQLSVWTGRVTASVSINGSVALSSTLDGSFGFRIYLGNPGGHTRVGDQSVPNGSVLGSSAGGFNAEVSSQKDEISGTGTVAHFLGGKYDQGDETIRIRLRPSSVDANGRQRLLGDPVRGIPPTVSQLSVAWNTGRRSPMDDAYRDIPGEVVMLEPPHLPRVHPSRAAESTLIGSIPQTDDERGEMITLDLRNPNPQTITQTSKDKLSRETRATTWTFVLVPLFSIMRDACEADAPHSFVSTDSISFHVSVPGVTIPGSNWEKLISWRVTGQGPHSGNGNPSQASQQLSFSFTPNPSNRPVTGSGTRNRPISYDVSAVIEGSTQHYFMAQDELDTLRQEYIDHGLKPIPKRREFAPHPIDHAMNGGNYNFILDLGIRGALDEITREFTRLRGGRVDVSRGYLSPQRSKMTTGRLDDAFGLSFEIAPQEPGQQACMALGQACSRAGYSFVCKDESDDVVLCESASVTHLRVTLPMPRERDG